VRHISCYDRAIALRTVIELKANLVAICIALVASTGVAIAQAPVSDECQLGCSRAVWATPGNDDRLFVDVLHRFPIPPEKALQVFERESERQAGELRTYTATTLISVELPDMSRRGEFELRRLYVAPKTLEFTPLRFTGDDFVKTNVIARLLQSEVTRLQNLQPFATAINQANYTISFRETTQIDGRLVHAYQLKPRKRRVGLFEGRIFLDAFNGNLVRKEGRLVKTPSFVLKKVEFAQDYTDIGGFTFLEHTHSAVSTRMIGRTVVDIYQYDYRFPSASPAIGGQTLAEAGTAVSQEH
jgi:hypothetical protein